MSYGVPIESSPIESKSFFWIVPKHNRKVPDICQRLETSVGFPRRFVFCRKLGPFRISWRRYGVFPSVCRRIFSCFPSVLSFGCWGFFQTTCPSSGRVEYRRVVPCLWFEHKPPYLRNSATALPAISYRTKIAAVGMTNHIIYTHYNKIIKQWTVVMATVKKTAVLYHFFCC